MKLKTIKEKLGDTHYTKYVFQALNLIQDKCNLNKTSTVFFLGYFYFGQIFLYDNILYVANISMDSAIDPDVSTMKLTELYRIKLLKDYPVNQEDINCEAIITNRKNLFTPEKFLFWIDEPCDINYEIDKPYYEIIKFLNNYTKETFRTERYLFYSKKDNDYNFINNIYAYDLKNQAEMKLYAIEKDPNNDGNYIPPQELKDIAIDDLSGKLSIYQQRQCKKAFLKLANQKNSYFDTKNYWVMELVKLAVQPVLILREWSLHRCFCKPKLFGHIWVYDFPEADEEPSFMIIDDYFTKVAVLSFFTPVNQNKNIYKRYMAKAKSWQLNKDEVQNLIEFLNAPCSGVCSGRKYEKDFEKYAKTNWQKLIFEYNHNTAGWGWGDTGFDIPPEKDTNRESDVQALPFDLPIPDYTKLLKEE